MNNVNHTLTILQSPTKYNLSLCYRYRQKQYSGQHKVIQPTRRFHVSVIHMPRRGSHINLGTEFHLLSTVLSLVAVLSSSTEIFYNTLRSLLSVNMKKCCFYRQWLNCRAVQTILVYNSLSYVNHFLSAFVSTWLAYSMTVPLERHILFSNNM